MLFRSNFTGEVLVLFGAWKSLPLVVGLAAWGALIIGAVYMLRATRIILHGPLPEKWSEISDANLWRKLPFALLLATLLIVGCWPRVLVDKIEPSAKNIVGLATGQSESQLGKKALRKAPVRKSSPARATTPPGKR